MHISITSLLGMAFLFLAFAATFTMFQFWGYEYDEVNKKSSCPQWKMNIHRGIGFAYIIVYILMMKEMVPRLWEYQVELPPRTVVHVLLGTLIGIILILKVSILRFFRHFEEWMPVLGVSLLVSSVLLGVLSLPTFYREQVLAAGVYAEDNLKRVAVLFPKADFPEEVDVALLATKESLVKGREVLLEKCVSCHDLKTIISKPRTPKNWVRTSIRMVKKPTLAQSLSEEEGYLAASYLIAITPDLQRSAKLKRKRELISEDTRRSLEEVLKEEPVVVEPAVVEPTEKTIVEPAVVKPTEKTIVDTGATGTSNGKGKKLKIPTSGGDATLDKIVPTAKPKPKPKPKPKFNFKAAKALYNEECSGCHDLSDVDESPPGSRREVNQMLSRMVENGLELNKKKLSLIRGYLIRKYVRKH